MVSHAGYVNYISGGSLARCIDSLPGSIISGMTDGLMYSVEGPIITCEHRLP